MNLGEEGSETAEEGNERGGRHETEEEKAAGAPGGAAALGRGGAADLPGGIHSASHQAEPQEGDGGEEEAVDQGPEEGGRAAPQAEAVDVVG